MSNGRDTTERIVWISARVPESLRRRAKVKAAGEDRPLNDILIELLEQWVARTRKAA